MIFGRMDGKRYHTIKTSIFVASTLLITLVLHTLKTRGFYKNICLKTNTTLLYTKVMGGKCREV